MNSAPSGKRVLCREDDPLQSYLEFPSKQFHSELSRSANKIQTLYHTWTPASFTVIVEKGAFEYGFTARCSSGSERTGNEVKLYLLCYL